MQHYIHGVSKINEYNNCIIEWIFYNKEECQYKNGRVIVGSDPEITYYVSASINDALHQFPKIIFINKVEVEKELRGKGFGSKALKQFVEEHSLPIILEAGFLDRQDYEEAYNNFSLFDQHLSGLENFYTRSGFINVNDQFGCYEEKITMAYLP